MRFYIGQEPGSVTLEQVYTPTDDLKVTRLDINLILRPNVILGADMHIPHRQQRDSRDWVIIVCDSIVPTGLVAYEAAESGAADARAA